MLINDKQATSFFLQAVVLRNYKDMEVLLADTSLYFIIPQFTSMSTYTTYDTRHELTWSIDDKFIQGDMRIFWKKCIDDCSNDLPENWFQCWVWSKKESTNV